MRAFVIAFFIAMGCFAQRPEFLSGQLRDSQTKEPVVFATIRIKNRAIGIISNMDGSFKIPHRFKSFGDTLEVSSMGYVSKVVLLSKMIPDRINIFEVLPALEQLDEVIVQGKKNNKNRKALSSRQIVKRAIDNIPNNYPYAPFSNVGYYRDYQFKEDKFHNLNEAIIEVFDLGFGTIDISTSNFSMYEYKRNLDFPRDTVAERPYDYQKGLKIIPGAKLADYGGNEFVILRVHDAIRNHKVNAFDFVNRLDIDFMNHHSFELMPEVLMAGERLYTIAFFKSESDIWAEGKLYIAKSDFSIYGLDYDIYKLDKRNRLNALNKDEKRDKKIFAVKIQYQRAGEKMHLNYISVNNIFELREPAIFKLRSIQVNVDLKCYELNFTTAVEEASATKTSHYKLKYKGKISKFKNVEVYGKKVLLFPKLVSGDLEYELFSISKKSDDNDEFEFEIRNLKDVYGNIYDTSKMVEVNQFREFFVQEVKPGEAATDGTLFMNKTRPIFKNQPITAPENMGDYWMNSPLKTNSN